MLQQNIITVTAKEIGPCLCIPKNVLTSNWQSYFIKKARLIQLKAASDVSYDEPGKITFVQKLHRDGTILRISLQLNSNLSGLTGTHRNSI